MGICLPAGNTTANRAFEGTRINPRALQRGRYALDCRVRSEFGNIPVLMEFHHERFP